MALKTVDPRFSVYVGNLSNGVSLSDMEELLYELFLQAGPLVGVSIPTVDKERKNQHRGCAFVEFQHQVSVNYAIELLNQIKLFGCPMKVSYMTAGSNSGNKSVTQSPTTPRTPTQSPFGGNNLQSYLSFSDSPTTPDARQLISPHSRSTNSHGGAYYTPPVSSNRDQHHDRPGRSASHGSNYYPNWLQRDTIRQINDWREREQERSRQSNHQHHRHGHHSNGYPSSYR